MTVNSLLHCFIFFHKLRCLPLVPRPSPIAMQKEHWFDELHLYLDKHATKRNSFDPHNYSTTQQGRQDCHTHFAEEGMDLSKAPHTSQWRRQDLSSGSLTLTVQHLCTRTLHLESPSLLSLLDILGGHQPHRHILCKASFDSHGRRQHPLLSLGSQSTLQTLGITVWVFHHHSLMCSPCHLLRGGKNVLLDIQRIYLIFLAFNLWNFILLGDSWWYQKTFFCHCLRREGMLLVSTE